MMVDIYHYIDVFYMAKRYLNKRSSKCLYFYFIQNIPQESQELILTAQRLPLCIHWCIVMAAGGHFAIALFERDKIIQHKTFHKYIIRAKQGSAQTAHDQKTGGKARSAGANLRRQNMLHLKQVKKKKEDFDQDFSFHGFFFQ